MISCLLIHVKELIHYSIHIITMAIAAWLANERHTLKEVLEDGLERRHKIMNLKNIEQIPGIITEVLQLFADGKVLANKLGTDPDAIKFIDDAEFLEQKLKGLVA